MTKLIALLFIATAWGQVHVGGDLSGSSTKPTVIKIQTVPINKPTVTGTSPVFDGTSIVWQTISAGSPSTLPWTSITGRPTALSQFTNDLNFLTPSGTAAKANALSKNPGACPAGQYVYQFDPDGTIHCATPAGTGGTGGAVDWANVTGRPTALSAFTNDAGFITSAGSILGNAATATSMQTAKNPCSAGQFMTGMQTNWTPICADPPSVASSVPWTSVTGRPTAVSAFSNDSGYLTANDNLQWGKVVGAPTIPTLTSQLTNDSGFITSAVIPTKVSQLQNDLGFIGNAGGNATSASHLLNTPTVCNPAPGSGQFAYGIDSSGNALCATPTIAVPNVSWATLQMKPPISYNYPDAGMVVTGPTAFTSGLSVETTNPMVTLKPAGATNYNAASIAVDNSNYHLRTWNNDLSGYADFYAGTIYSNGKELLNSDTVDWVMIQHRPTALSQFTNDVPYVTTSQMNAAITAAGSGVSATQWTGTRTIQGVLGGDPNTTVSAVTLKSFWRNTVLTNASVQGVSCWTDTGTATLTFKRLVEADTIGVGSFTCNSTTGGGAGFAPGLGFTEIARNDGIGLVLADGATAHTVHFIVQYTPTY